MKKTFALMVMVTFFWAVGHPVGRIMAGVLHPFQIACITLTTGFLCVFLYLLVSKQLYKIKQISAKDIIISLILGIFGFFFYQICTFSALARVPASMNSILVTTNVIFITVFSIIVLKERVRFVTALGICLALAGTALVIFNQGFHIDGSFNVVGSLFSLGAALSFTIYSISGKEVISRNDPIIIASLALFSGMAILLVFSSVTVGFEALTTLSAKNWLLLLFLGAGMIGIAYPVWFACLKKVNASEIAIFIYLTPVFAGLLSYLILKEVFGWMFYLGAVLILGGISVSRYKKAGS
jgi:drug/metabolite transporter (DMT)-like permease